MYFNFNINYSCFGFLIDRKEKKIETAPQNETPIQFGVKITLVCFCLRFLSRVSSTSFNQSETHAHTRNEE